MSSNSKQTTKSSNKQNYFQWKKEHILSLIEALGKSVGNKGLNYYGKYQGGSKTTTPKKITAKEIAKELGKLNHDSFSITDQQVQSKIKGLNEGYNKAHDYLRSTGEGIDDDDEKLKIETIRAKVLNIEPFFDELDPLIRDRPKSTPHFNADSELTDLSQQADTFLLHSSGVDEIDDEEESSNQEETRGDHDKVEVVEEPIISTSQKRPSEDESSKKASKKPRKGAANIAASLLHMVEAKAEIEKEKIKHCTEIDDKRFELEKEKMEIMRQQVAIRLQESKERSLQLELELEKLKEKNRRENQE
ncbi:hypothetical protein INT45_007400 [Circinella minor]|uniref:Myb/SANT-like DNA-binding domain-containing protein n=1 Tax=Circinella minor TaxID=1195481 RepID=A0A8H7VE09_9FUNG|nr:hypothetical protein INT45_007400 [Circinella minor]